MIKWVVRLAFITGLLGVAGTMVIIFHFLQKHEGKNILKEDNKKEAPLNNLKVDSKPILTQSNRVDSSNTAKPVLSEKIESPDTAISTPVKENEEKVSRSLSDKTADNKKIAEQTAKPRKVEKPIPQKKEQEKKIFNKRELQLIVKRINRQKKGRTSNCVQIHSTEESNNKRRTLQVEKYLKSHNFSIVGREVVSKSVKGILITPVGECIRITIGTF